jgi:hypothetical protein
MNRHLVQRVELYFVLYLLGLLLLLEPAPPRAERVPTASPREVSPIELSLLPSELRCLVEDSAGRRRLRAYDSVATLRYLSSAELISLSARLDSAGRILWESDQADIPSPITIEHDPEQRLFSIRWRPPWWNPSLPAGQHVYVLRLLLQHGTPTKQYIERLSLPLRLEILPLGAVPAPEPTRTESPSIPLPPVALHVPDPEIEAPPYGRWEVEIAAYGIDLLRQLAQAPTLRLLGSPGGSATVTIRTPTTLLVSGTAPPEGRLRVLVQLQRYDGAQAEAEFAVLTRPLSPPDVPEEIYPERPYTLDPKLRLRGQQTRVELSDGQRLWASSAGTPLTVTASLADTGKELLLRRFINERLVDETRIPIRDFPAPEILEVRSTGDGAVMVTTRCFGTVGNTANLCTLTSSVGQVRELYGNRRRRTLEPYGIVTEQTFLLEQLKSPPSLDITVQDRAGRQSRWSGRPLQR